MFRPFDIRRDAVVAIASVALIMGSSACSSSTGGSPSTPSGGTQAPRSSNVAPSASGACLDLARLGDLGETVSGAMQTMSDDLKAGNLDAAKAAAATTATGLRSLADYVATAQPPAARQLRAAADTVDQATTSFPAGTDRISQAQNDLNEGFELAKTAACPS